MTNDEMAQVIFSLLQAVCAAMTGPQRVAVAAALQQRIDHKLDGLPAEVVHGLCQALRIAFPDDFRDVRSLLMFWLAACALRWVTDGIMR